MKSLGKLVLMATCYTAFAYLTYSTLFNHNLEACLMDAQKFICVSFSLSAVFGVVMYSVLTKNR